MIDREPQVSLRLVEGSYMRTNFETFDANALWVHLCVRARESPGGPKCFALEKWKDRVEA